MNEVYEIRIDTRVEPSLRALSHVTRSRLAWLIDRVGADLGDVLASDQAIRIPDTRIIDRYDPMLAFFEWRDHDLRVGFYVDRQKKRIYITGVHVKHQT